MDTLSYLFEVVKNLAKENIEQDPRFDGRKIWKLIENYVKSRGPKNLICMEMKIRWILPWETRENILSNLTKVNKMWDKPLKESNIDYFLRQHVRIPTNYVLPSLLRIIQLAYNIGQFQGKNCEKLIINNF